MITGIVLGIGSIIIYILIVKTLWFSKEETTYYNRKKSIGKRIIKVIVMLVLFVAMMILLSKILNFLKGYDFSNISHYNLKDLFNFPNLSQYTF